jgi:hypothetical protein
VIRYVFTIILMLLQHLLFVFHLNMLRHMHLNVSV